MKLPQARRSKGRTAPVITAPIIEVHTHPRSAVGVRQLARQLTGAAGAGVAAMYFLDPDRGAARRAKIRDRMIHAQHEVQDGMDTLQRDLQHRRSGIGAGVRYRFAGGDVDDAVLVERVRSKLGLVAGHPKAIDVSASDGQVRLGGDVLEEEHRSVVRAVSKVPGVKSVTDQLRVHHDPDGVSGLQGSSRKRRRRPNVMQENWSPTTRLMGGVVSVGLLGAGRRVGGLSGLVVRGGGLAMAARAAANKPLRQVTGVGAGRNAVETEAAVTIDAPPEELWPLISSYTNFPTFMSNVLSVERLPDSSVTRWTVRGPAHTDITFDAEETLREEGHRIGWKTLPGQTVAHAGDIAVYRSDGRSRVQVRMHYNPVAGEIGHGLAALFGSDARHRIREDLLRLRELAENRKHDGKPATAPA